MAESQSNTSTVNLKDNNSLLDLDIGKDFLSSWKSMSVVEEVGMDFDFAPVSKGKKKTFSFEKVDMDFNLDSDFGKIPSFNMDMADLDISPPEKGAKPNAKSKVESSGNEERKTDQFTFKFDFDKLGSFDFETDFAEDHPKALEKLKTFQSSPGDSASPGKEDSSNMNINENKSTLAKEHQTILSPGTAIHFDQDYQAQKDPERSRNNSSSELAIHDVGNSKLLEFIEEGASDKTQTSSEPTVATTIQPKIHQFEKLILPDQVNIEPLAGNFPTSDLSSNTQSNNELSVESSIYLLDKVDTLDMGSTESMEDQEANVAQLSKSICNQLTTSENSHLLQSSVTKNNSDEKIQSRIDINGAGNKETTEIGQLYTPAENSCMTSVTPESPSDILSASENQRSNSEIHKLPSLSRSIEDLICGSAKPLDTCSRSLIQSVNAKSCAQKGSSFQTRVSSLTGQKSGVICDKERGSILGDKKLASISLEPSKTLNELPHKQNLENCKDIKIFRMGSISDGQKCEEKMIGSSTKQNIEALKPVSSSVEKEACMKGLDILSMGSIADGQKFEKKMISSSTKQNIEALKAASSSMEKEAYMKGLDILRNSMGSIADGQKCERKMISSSTKQNIEALKTVSSSMEKEACMKGLDILRKTSHNSENRTVLFSDVSSLPTMKNIPDKEEKALAVEGGQRNPDFCVSKNSSLNHDSTNSSILKGVHSSANIAKSNVISMKLPADVSILSNSLKQTLSTMSLKRKTVEGCSDVTVLNPSKRFSESLHKMRNFDEKSERVADKRVPNPTDMDDLCIKTTSRNLDTPHEEKFKKLEIEIPFSVETDANIKLAETYSKELDKICNMLRKMHGETKETLVRSVVNSNKLLLLLNNTHFKEMISF